ncbi:MAG: phospholipid carrier-dependent glycosyltransferase [Gammaproteobacteria bacterium]
MSILLPIHSADTPLLSDQRHWRVAVLLLLILATLVAVVDVVHLPLDDHEVFVAESAQEMHDRGDWIVPYFNGQPRLNKPPLNYWLAAAAAWLTGDLAHIQGWHARAPSVLGGLGMVLLTLYIGVRLYDRQTAWLAGLIMASSAGFLMYTHNARPEMLYSFFCTAGIAAFINAWQADDQSRRQRWSAWSMWLAFALATMTKGPQLPLMLLAAMVIFLRTQRLLWARIARILRPLSGFAIIAVLCVPWWWALHLRLGGAGLRGSQLSGSELRPIWPPTLYYLYRPLQQILPWLVLLPGAVLAPWRKPGVTPARLLGLLIIVPALILCLGRLRWFYLLPALAPMCLLLAASAVSLFRASGDPAPWWRKWILPVHWGLLVAGALWLLTQPDAGVGRVLLALVVITGIFVPTMMAADLRARQPLIDVVAMGLMFAGAAIALAPSPAVWGDREAPQKMTQAVLAQVPANARLAVLKATPNTVIYYAQRRIVRYTEMDEVVKALEQAPDRQLYLMVKVEDFPMLRARLGVAPEVLFTSTMDEGLQLVKLVRP